MIVFYELSTAIQHGSILIHTLEYCDLLDYRKHHKHTCHRGQQQDNADYKNHIFLKPSIKTRLVVIFDSIHVASILKRTCCVLNTSTTGADVDYLFVSETENRITAVAKQYGSYSPIQQSLPYAFSPSYNNSFPVKCCRPQITGLFVKDFYAIVNECSVMGMTM